MNIATIGIGVDPTNAKSGAAEVRRELQSVAQEAKNTVAAVQQATGATTAQQDRLRDSLGRYATAATSAGKAQAEAFEQGNSRMAASARTTLANHDRIRDSLGRFAREAGDAVNGMADDTDKAGDKITGKLEEIQAMLAKLAAAVGFAALIKEGLDFNATLEDVTLGIAAVQKQFDPDRFSTFADAMKVSADAVEVLKKKAAESPATFKELAQAFQGLSGAFTAAGLTMQQQIDLTVLMSQALAGLGIRSEQILQESRALVTGNINEDAAAARILGITKADIDRAKEAGNLYGFLTSKLAAFGEAGKAAAGTFTVGLSNLHDAFEQALGAATQQLFQNIKGEFASMTAAIASPQFAAGISNTLSLLSTILKLVADLAKVLVDHAALVGFVVKAYVAWWLAAKVISFGTIIGGLLASAAAWRAQAVAVEQSTAAMIASKAVGGLAAIGPQALVAGGLLALSYADTRTNDVQATIAKQRADIQQSQASIGLAGTDDAKLQARADILRKIATLQDEMAQKSKNPFFFFDAAQVRIMQEAVDFYNLMLAGLDKNAGAQLRVNAELADYQKQLTAANAALAKQIDEADTVEKKAAAIFAMGYRLEESGGIKAITPDQIAALQEYTAGLDRLQNNFAALAGKNTQAKADAKQLALDRQAISMALDRELALAIAKGNQDQIALRAVADAKRQEELLKNEVLQQVKNKDLVYAAIQKIIAAEQVVLNIQQAQSVNDKNRAFRLSGLEGQARLDELNRQRSQVAAEEAAKLRRAGIQGVSDSPTSAQLNLLMSGTDYVNPGINDTTAIQRDALIGASRDKLRELEVQAQETGKAMLKIGLKEELKTDVQTVADLTKELGRLQQVQGLSPLDRSRRIAELKEGAIGNLRDPMGTQSKYPELLDKFRAYKAEQELIEKTYNARMEADQNTFFQSFQHGIESTTEKWGNFNQQVDKMGGAIATSLSTNMTAAFSAIIDGSKSAGDAFRDMTIAILNDIAKVIIQLLVEMAIRAAIKALGGGTGASTGGAIDREGLVAPPSAEGLTQSTAPSVSVGGSSPVRGGGSGSGSGSGLDLPLPGGTDFETPLFASGGPVNRGGRGGVDDIHAMLTRGEYVIPKDAASWYGTRWLDMVRTRRVPRYADGGQVGGNVRGFSGTSDTFSFAINVKVGGGDDGDPLGSGSQAAKRKKGEALAKQIEQICRQTIRDEKRPGGALVNGKK